MTASLLLFGILLPWLFAALACWIGYQLIRQNGRILLRLDTLEQRLAEPGLMPAPAQAPRPPAGLPVGSEAPAFELPDLANGRKALADFRGKRLLLIFFNPRCGFCAQMAPDLAALPTHGADGHPLPLVVSTGEASQNRKLVEEHGIRCPVLLQQQMEVAAKYQARGTPTGYLIDEEGRIASALGVGAPALLGLADAAPVAGGENGNGKKEPKGNRSLAHSHINRNGLPAGTPAPDFTLPRLHGGEISLSDYRGRRVLLVFSDPHCGPCEQLAPQLVERARQSPELQVLMVSRGDPEENRLKADEHGFPFPVALQRQWEVSKQYAMFATPIAYLANEEGILAADVAIGVEPILALLSSATVGRCHCGKIAGESGCARKNGVSNSVSLQGTSFSQVAGLSASGTSNSGIR